MFEVKARSGAATPSDLGGMSAAGAQLGWGAWGKRPLPGNCSAGCGHNPLGKKRGTLAAPEEIRGFVLQNGSVWRRRWAAGQHSQQKQHCGVRGSSTASGWDRRRGCWVPALTLSLMLPSLRPPLHWLEMSIVVLFCCIFWPLSGPAGF